MKRILLAVVTLTYALGFSTGCAKGKKFNVGRTAASSSSRISRRSSSASR
ncbi:hypothetical protein ACN28S_46015 [Cystobacter fuscus]